MTDVYIVNYFAVLVTTVNRIVLRVCSKMCGSAFNEIKVAVEPMSDADVFVRYESVSVIAGHSFPPLSRHSLIQHQHVAFVERQFSLSASAEVIQSDCFFYITLYSTTVMII